MMGVIQSQAPGPIPGCSTFPPPPPYPVYQGCSETVHMPEGFTPSPPIEYTGQCGELAGDNLVVKENCSPNMHPYDNFNHVRSEIDEDQSSRSDVRNTIKKCEVVHVSCSGAVPSNEDDDNDLAMLKDKTPFETTSDCDILFCDGFPYHTADDNDLNNDADSCDDGTEHNGDNDNDDNPYDGVDEDETKNEFNPEMFARSSDSGRNVQENSSEDSGCGSEAGSRNGESTVTSVEVNETADHLHETLHLTEVEKPDCSGEECVVTDTELAALIEQEKPFFRKTTVIKQTNSHVPSKFVRPMKDIPPRFKKILETAAMSRNAAMLRHQFEGMPLVRQPREAAARNRLSSARGACLQGPVSDASAHTFNPNAQVFVPSQGSGALHEHPRPHLVKNPQDSAQMLGTQITPPSGSTPSAPDLRTPVYTIHVVNSNTCNVDGGCSNLCLTSAPLPSPTGSSYMTTGVSGQYTMQYMAPPPPPGPPNGPAFVYHSNTQYVYSQ